MLVISRFEVVENLKRELKGTRTKFEAMLSFGPGIKNKSKNGETHEVI